MGFQTYGNFVRLHSNVFVGPNALIKDYVWIFPHTVLTDDPHPPSAVSLGVTLEEFSIVAASCCLLPGVTVGSQALVGAGSLVKHDVEPGWVVAGQPSKKIVEASKIKLKDGSGHFAYPWTRHFHRGYPDDVVAQWIRAADEYVEQS
jgi:acetyltransferase-like isoleucine patch superfamily enzyme